MRKITRHCASTHFSFYSGFLFISSVYFSRVPGPSASHTRACVVLKETKKQFFKLVTWPPRYTGIVSRWCLTPDHCYHCFPISLRVNLHCISKVVDSRRLHSMNCVNSALIRKPKFQRAESSIDGTLV